MEFNQEDMNNIFKQINIKLPKVETISPKIKKMHAKINEFWTDEVIKMVKRFDIETIKLKNYKFNNFLKS